MKTFRQFKSELNSSLMQIREISRVERLIESLQDIRQSGATKSEELLICTLLDELAKGVFADTETGSRIENIINNEEIRENNIVKRIFNEIPINEAFRHGGDWYRKVSKTSFINIKTEKKYHYSDDMPDFYVYQDAEDRTGSTRFAMAVVSEDVPANAVGSPPGAVAGVSDGEPVVRKKKFANHDVFDVDSDTFNKCRMGKLKYARWAKYIDKDSDEGKTLYDYAVKNSKKAIIVRHKDSGVMLYARRK